MSGDIFDQYAEKYDDALNQSISISGEAKDYFAHGRIQFLSSLLKERHASVKSIMDFGCGTGSASPHLIEILSPTSLLGVDTSPLSLKEANIRHSSKTTRFRHLNNTLLSRRSILLTAVRCSITSHPMSDPTLLIMSTSH